jgi:dihydrodipicolinate synthase/N-acetylneuraminate lyase
MSMPATKPVFDARLIDTESRRAQLLQRLFPRGIPTLWCPALTHYTADGAIDELRIIAHLSHLAPHVKGFLIPGSTGDGWELNDQEFWKLLDIGLAQIQKLELELLVGILKADAGAALEQMTEVLSYIKSRTGESDSDSALLKARVRGFTVCAPRGKQVSQVEMERGLVSILESGLPVTLYQLPQITENEMSPELLVRLAERFANFIMFKDSSGGDSLVLSGVNLHGVFTMRGAEGDYVRWLNKPNAGYDGFLLSTANSLAAYFHQMLDHSTAGRIVAAREVSDRVAAVVNGVFEVVRPSPEGNIYANANKAMDHFFAFGPGAADLPGPRVHAGSRLPREMLQKTGEILQRHGLMPPKGYL